MNLYILVEDGKSGHKLIDHWMGQLLPSLTRVSSVGDVIDHHYVIFSGLGYPRILGTDESTPQKNVLGQTIQTINQSQKFDYLLIFLDGDDEGVELRKTITTNKIKSYSQALCCPFQIFVQNKCVETWLLGNREFFPMEYSKNFLPFVQHYNVSMQDPELMKMDHRQIATTNALYHERYLRQMMQEMGRHYTKSRPDPIMYSPEFIAGLQKRINETDHLNSLKEFFCFIETLKKEENTERIFSLSNE